MPRLSQKLTRPVMDKAGNIIRTRKDARDYMVALPPRRAKLQAWQGAARMLLEGEDIERLTMQIEFALMVDGQRKFR